MAAEIDRKAQQIDGKLMKVLTLWRLRTIQTSYYDPEFTILNENCI